MAVQPLRIIYHGVLNTYQKRILDLPKVIECLHARRVPIEVTIAGKGPQEQELLESCRSFLNAGVVRFFGLVPHERIPALLQQHDVYLLLSAFEGMPHALLEAMVHGCVPVVSDIASGVRDVIVEGVNGFKVQVGNVVAFADRLQHLQAHPAKCCQLAATAYESVSRSPYTVDAMVDAYLALFARIAVAAQSGAYRRPAGPVLPPPLEVAGVVIFPVQHRRYVETVEDTWEGENGRTLMRRMAGKARRTWRAWLNRRRNPVRESA
jgi:glycosyltransferase involved in cell wall biosynthesis